MGIFGRGLIAMVGLVLVLTGLPAFAVFILAAVLGAVGAVALGSVRAAVLASLSKRLINLLESDLLQALPLYFLMGVLLNRMSIAPAVFRTLLRGLPKRPGAPLVAGLGLGALLGPISGSVGASILALARAVEPSLCAAGLPAPVRRRLRWRARWVWSFRRRWCSSCSVTRCSRPIRWPSTRPGRTDRVINPGRAPCRHHSCNLMLGPEHWFGLDLGQPRRRRQIIRGWRKAADLGRGCAQHRRFFWSCSWAALLGGTSSQ